MNLTMQRSNSKLTFWIPLVLFVLFAAYKLELLTPQQQPEIPVEDSQSETVSTRQIYRFYSDSYGAHFYSTDRSFTEREGSNIKDLVFQEAVGYTR